MVSIYSRIWKFNMDDLPLCTVAHYFPKRWLEQVPSICSEEYVKPLLCTFQLPGTEKWKHDGSPSPRCFPEDISTTHLWYRPTGATMQGDTMASRQCLIQPWGRQGSWEKILCSIFNSISLQVLQPVKSTSWILLVFWTLLPEKSQTPETIKTPFSLRKNLNFSYWNIRPFSTWPLSNSLASAPATSFWDPTVQLHRWVAGP